MPSFPGAFLFLAVWWHSSAHGWRTQMSCWGLEIVSVVVPWSSFWCLLVSPLRYQVGCPLGNCLQASRQPSCLSRSGYLPSKGLLLGHAAGRQSGLLSDSRPVCLSLCWVSQSFLAMTCGLPWSFLHPWTTTLMARYSLSPPDLPTSTAGILIQTTPPLCQSVLSCRKSSYPLMVKRWASVTWVSWIQMMSSPSLFMNSCSSVFFFRSHSEFHCTKTSGTADVSGWLDKLFACRLVFSSWHAPSPPPPSSSPSPTPPTQSRVTYILSEWPI